MTPWAFFMSAAAPDPDRAPRRAASGSVMGCTCVVGLQWGDEAKGKIVDLLGDQHDYVVRYNGGANAGHTIVWGDRTFKLSLLPSGVLKPQLRSVVGNGLVVDPQKFLDEIEQLRKGGIAVGDNLFLSDHAHVIFPYHVAEDKLTEGGGEGAIGTTGRGIGPCYSDKVGRVCGVRIGELLYPDHLRQRLRFIVPRKNRVLAALANGTPAPVFDADSVSELYLGYGEKLRPFIADTARLLQQAERDGKHILFEAAQGSLLDIDHGTYPYVTSSNSSPAGVWSGSGVPARRLTRVVGVVKAYTSRVGRGPFPTELDDAAQKHDPVGKAIRDKGREYGTVTGRPRRVGWFDAVSVRAAAALAGADELAVMLLDVLGVADEIQIGTAYHLDGERLNDFPGDAFKLERCRPVYESLPGWRTDLSAARKLPDLPAAARRYVDRIGELIGLPVTVVSVGPSREQTIFCR
jgi:adenylosuccinate synthase